VNPFRRNRHHIGDVEFSVRRFGERKRTHSRRCRGEIEALAERPLDCRTRQSNLFGSSNYRLELGIHFADVPSSSLDLLGACEHVAQLVVS
jgi:hypothetical protein